MHFFLGYYIGAPSVRAVVLLSNERAFNVRRKAKLSKSWDQSSRLPPGHLPWWSTTTMPLRPGCRISGHPEKGVRNSAASSSRPAVGDSNCRRTAAADIAGTDRRPAGRCCSPSTNRTGTRSTRRRSNRVRSDCGKAPSYGAYPPVRPGC